MPNEWYYRQEGKVEGPFSPGELREKARAGEITPEASIRRGASGPWVPATKVQGLLTAPRQQPVSGAPSAPPVRVVANCWYCGNLRRVTDRFCGSCGASWTREAPPVVAAQQKATRSTGPRAMIGLIFLLVAGLALAGHGFSVGGSMAIGAGGLALAGIALFALLLPGLVRAVESQPGKRTVPTKTGKGSAPQAGGASKSSEAVVAATESFRRGVGYVGYVALWLSVVSIAAIGIMVAIMVASIIAMFFACLSEMFSVIII